MVLTRIQTRTASCDGSCWPGCGLPSPCPWTPQVAEEQRDVAAGAVLPYAAVLEQARQTAERVRDAAAYKWVRLDLLCA
jgi:hypothetical protein